MVNCYNPTSLKEALQILATEAVIPYAGGTDLMIEDNSDTNYLFINQIPELRKIQASNNSLRIGACCTFTDIMESMYMPDLFKEATIEIAAPAIRNIGTVGGNICNGSPKADFALVLFAAKAILRLASSTGERLIPISEFYLDRNKTVLRPDELLVEIIIEDIDINNYYYKKVGDRKALAISRIAFVAVINVDGGKITTFRTAFGAIDRVILQRPDIDEMMIGKTIEEAQQLKDAYIKAYDLAINPIRGRVSAEYRKDVCMNLLNDFLASNGI